MANVQTKPEALVITRTFNAPRDQVFRAWTDLEAFARWFGPKGGKTTVLSGEVRSGGAVLYSQRFGDGPAMIGKFEYQEVDAPERLVYISAFADEEGNVVRAPFSESWPLRIENTVSLEDLGRQTTLTMSAFPLDASEAEAATFTAAAEMVRQGCAGMLDVLDEFLTGSKSKPSKLKLSTPSDTEIVMVREFAAPPSLIFEVFTQPDHIAKWWGCGESTMTVNEAGVCVGGTFRRTLRAADGSEHPFRGEYLEVEAPHRLVYTEIYDLEPYSQFVATCTTTFEASATGTRLTETVRHLTKEARDGHLGSGMESGAATAFDRLEAHVHTLPVRQTKINAYLLFSGNCQEAMEFYRSCLGGDLEVMPIAGSPMAGEMPAEMHGKVMHACLKRGPLVLMASDLCEAGGETQGRSMNLMLDCATEAETYAVFERLSEGGTVGHPVSPAFWGGLFGQLTDRFGISWMLTYGEENA